MSQETLFKPLTEQSKAAVVETANALVEWSKEKNLPPHILTSISEYYKQLATLAHETALLEKEAQENLAKDFEEEERNESNTGPITKSDV